jgi:hypothetical protein
VDTLGGATVHGFLDFSLRTVKTYDLGRSQAFLIFKTARAKLSACTTRDTLILIDFEFLWHSPSSSI